MAAQAAELDHTWLSGLLTRFQLFGATGGRQGVRRSLTPDAICCAVLVHDLMADGGLRAEAAVDLAHRLMTAPQHELVLGPGRLLVRAEVAEMRRRMRRRLEDAVERSVEVRRGRPPATG
ncbi:MAG: hypothetical protein HYX65_02145 [Gemmatimonadetes bacterium]|nr:hypothetical protein [Gemmatimonadota bacterium]